MPVANVVVHPAGLHPIEAVKAYYKQTEEHVSVDEIIAEVEVHNMKGDLPGRKRVYGAIRRVRDMDGGALLPQPKCANCGRKRALSEQQEAGVIAFVQKWRHKVFCTCHYIRNGLRLDECFQTVNNVLNKTVRVGKWERNARTYNVRETQL